METRRNLCAQIPESLHTQVREEQERLGQTLSQYVEQILREHFEGRTEGDMSTRTVAFQVSEALFQRLKAYLAAHGFKQREFLIGLIELELAEWESEMAALEKTETIA